MCRAPPLPITKPKPEDIEMAKLSIEFDEKFTTDGFWVTKDFEEVFLKGKDAIDYIESIDKSQTCLVIVTHNNEDPYNSIKFEFRQSDKKGKDTFDVDFHSDGSGLSVSISGSFSAKLRSGAESYFDGKNSLKILGIEYLGGSYRGFSSYIDGCDKENAGTWPSLTTFKVS